MTILKTISTLLSIHHHENTYIVEDNSGEGGSDGASKGELKAEGK
jgi:hypothetical protein